MSIIGLVLAFLFLMAVLRWWSEGVLDTSDAVLLGTVFGGLIFGLFAAQTWPQFLLAFVPLTAGGAYAVYSYRVGGVRSYYKHKCEEYIGAIEFDPRNLGAREYLAESLYNLGELERAIDEMEIAVNMGAGMECRYKLGKWQKELRARDLTSPICRWCSTEHPQGTRKCGRCGSDLPYESALSRWLVGGKTATTRYYLLVVFGVALASVSLLVLPLKLAFIPLLLCVLALAGWSLVNSARN